MKEETHNTIHKTRAPAGTTAERFPCGTLFHMAESRGAALQSVAPQRPKSLNIKNRYERRHPADR